MACRSSVHTSTKFTPNFPLFASRRHIHSTRRKSMPQRPCYQDKTEVGWGLCIDYGNHILYI